LKYSRSCASCACTAPQQYRRSSPSVSTHRFSSAPHVHMHECTTQRCSSSAPVTCATAAACKFAAPQQCNSPPVSCAPAALMASCMFTAPQHHSSALVTCATAAACMHMHSTAAIQQRTCVNHTSCPAAPRMRMQGSTAMQHARTCTAPQQRTCVSTAMLSSRDGVKASRRYTNCGSSTRGDTERDAVTKRASSVGLLGFRYDTVQAASAWRHCSDAAPQAPGPVPEFTHGRCAPS
jgi:hypothetical protein